MSEYIRREDALSETREWLLEVFGVQKDKATNAIGIIRRLEQAPSADVVPVVRCKDCKYWEERGG